MKVPLTLILFSAALGLGSTLTASDRPRAIAIQPEVKRANTWS